MTRKRVRYTPKMKEQMAQLYPIANSRQELQDLADEYGLGPLGELYNKVSKAQQALSVEKEQTQKRVEFDEREKERALKKCQAMLKTDNQAVLNLERKTGQYFERDKQCKWIP